MIIIFYVYFTNPNIRINITASSINVIKSNSIFSTFNISELVYNKVQISSEFIKILFNSKLSKNNVKISF